MKQKLKELFVLFYHETIKRTKELWLFPAALIAYILFFAIVFPNHPNCLVKLFFGVPCLGCGLTRSTIRLLFLDFKGSIKYHPYTLGVYFTCLVIFYKDMPFFKILYKSKVFWITTTTLFILTFILRMIYVYPDVPLDPYLKNILRKL